MKGLLKTSHMIVTDGPDQAGLRNEPPALPRMAQS
jgi:hypothetical protein